MIIDLLTYSLSILLTHLYSLTILTDPIGETMITDGLFTIIGAIFGSPMGTVIYFGHPIHKKIGGKAAFSFANGILYLIYP